MFRELSTISDDIHDFINDVCSAISKLKIDLKKEFKDELAKLIHELNKKLTTVRTRLQGHDQVITDAEGRISDVETSCSEKCPAVPAERATQTAG